MRYSLTDLNEKAFKNCKNNAKSREIDFDLSLNDYNQIINGNCYYCDTEPRKCFDGIRNGVDRLNSQLGYIPGNTISCCTTCNKMKGTLTHDQFMNKVELIYLENEKYKKMGHREKIAHGIKSGIKAHPRTIKYFIDSGLINEEDIHYDYLGSFLEFEEEVVFLKETLSRGIKLSKIPVFDYYNKVEKLSDALLTDFYKDLVSLNIVNMRKLVKAVGGDYKKVPASMKLPIEFRQTPL